tara:strand:- start:4902 stop:6014 length:1113 start_codon:yes stop_codon:yes gene_type:complete
MDDTRLREYNKTRLGNNHSNICNAPFNNMYLNVLGKVGPCWLTYVRDEAPTWGDDMGLHQIWFGDYFNKLREKIKNKDLSNECATCEKNISCGNFMGTLAQAYDNNYPLSEYPSVMELELSNLCNLECIMCRGELSSSIRKNRDKLPPLKIAYDDRLVKEILPFLPHLKEMRFNGGEPFMHQLCFNLWEKVSELNPDIEITVATNGTMLNNKIKSILDRCKFRINISVDALDEKNYEVIRKNANYKKVMSNIEYYADYCKKNNRIFSIMINPMKQNWWEMPDFVEWCNRNDYYLWFNTVVDPFDCSIQSMTKAEKENVYAELSKKKDFYVNHQNKNVTHIHNSNIKKYENFVENQVRVWSLEADKEDTSV